MNKTRKLTYTLVILAVLAGALAVAMPDKAAAKWLGLRQHFVPQAQQAADEASPAAKPAIAETVKVTVTAEPAQVAAAGTSASGAKVIIVDRTETAKPRVVVSSRKPVDVGPGVEGLDYGKVIKWQQDVDAGRDLWRLDPLEVAKREGRAYYGFDDTDTFTVVRSQDASAIARHGQVDVEVKHGGKTYTMIIVRPFGGGGAIWTTYRVTGAAVPQPPAEKVVFQTNKFVGWDWYKGSYPAGMSMAVVADYAAQLKYDDRIPEFVLARAKDVDYSEKVVLFAYLGMGGGADAIGIEKVTINGNSMTVYVRTRSIKPGEVETKNITNPSDFVAIDRSLVDIWGGVSITFVDQKGKVLGKHKISINHQK